MRLSARSQFESQPNRLTQALERARRDGTSPLDLTLSNPTLADLPEDPAHEVLGRLRAARYEPEPFGLRAARKAASEFMQRQGAEVSPERVILTASTSEAYGYLLKLLCDPGDEVLAARPSYPLLEQLAQLESVRIASYDIVLAERFCVDVESLHKARSDRSRAILAVHPNNPTGSYLRRHEIEAMLDTGLPLISDEVFAPYALEETQLPPVLSLANRGLVISLHGLSKLGLPQLKLAWMCVGGEPEHVSRSLERLELIADTYLSVATPVQLALPAILESRAPVIATLRARLRECLAIAREELRDSTLSALPVEGGFNLIVRAPNVRSDEDWAVLLLERAQVLVQPGYFYDFAGGPYLVLSLLVRPDVFREGVQRIRHAVESAL